MLTIQKIYFTEMEGQTRLCADVRSGDRGTTIWFGLPHAQARWLCGQRCDAFVMALLPMAMRTGKDIVCDVPMSRRLRYKLETLLVPALAEAGDLYHAIRIRCPVTDEPVPNEGAVGTGFTGGVDSLYTIMTHGHDSDYPLTHLAIFHSDFFGKVDGRARFREACQEAKIFAAEQGLETVFLDNNLGEALQERMLDVYGFRNVACAMALQGLFSQYLLSAGCTPDRFTMNLRETTTFELLTLYCTQTESLTIHWGGGAVRRHLKLKALAQWEPSHRWLHSCMRGAVGKPNCGDCRKCVEDQCLLYAQGNLEVFRAVYDVPGFYKRLPQRLAIVLMDPEDAVTKDVVAEMNAKQIPIPEISYRMAEQIRRTKAKMKENET